MTAVLLDGKKLSGTIAEELRRSLADLGAVLAVVRIGDDEASAGYARAIDRTCKLVGATYLPVHLPAAVGQDEAAAKIAALSADRLIHGIMLLEPTPAGIDITALIEGIDPIKDVDGVHPTNLGRLLANRRPYVVPATPKGGVRLLDSAGLEFGGKRAVVVGRSEIVGKPMALLLLHRNCTVTLAHSRTRDLPALCRSADILCVATGQPEMVKADWVSPGAVVVDFGTTYTETGLKGDCDQVAVAGVAGFITPVPGGTGPMTNIMLMENLEFAVRRLRKEYRE